MFLKDRLKIETDIDATEVILFLASEINGQVAVKAWEVLGKIISRDPYSLSKT